MTLSQLPPRFAADVLAQLPEEQRVAAVESLSRAESAPTQRPRGHPARGRAERQRQLRSPRIDRKAAAKRAAAVLNQLDSENATAIIEHLRAGDPEGAALIEDEMFQFADFLKLDNRAMQAVLAEVRPERLARALKGITDDERKVIFAALTEQVRTVVEAEISDSGPVPAREVKGRAARDHRYRDCRWIARGAFAFAPSRTLSLEVDFQFAVARPRHLDADSARGLLAMLIPGSASGGATRAERSLHPGGRECRTCRPTC